MYRYIVEAGFQVTEQPPINDQLQLSWGDGNSSLWFYIYLAERPFAYKLKYAIISYEFRLHNAQNYNFTCQFNKSAAMKGQLGKSD